MTAPVQKAVLLDLHPSSFPFPSNHAHDLQTPAHAHDVPDSPFICHHSDLVKEVNDTLLGSQPSCDLTRLYILTSSANDVSSVVDKLVSSEGQLHVTVVEADDRIASFYRSKQKLDALEVTQITLMCGTGCEKFWNYVCRDLLTPVYEWEVKAVELPAQDGRIHRTETRRTTANNHIVRSGSQKHDDLDPESPDGVRAEIRGFLRTLPSLLGLPEVERSRLLPGKEEGFVHGFSTRRGGVTTLPTLCSMNLVYTDKKRDSLLVVEENRRRLSLAGGFDPQTFHIVRVEHGHRVWVVGEDEQPLKYDALVTNRRDVTIAAAGADCIPLLFADPVGKVIGAAHAGWQGSLERVAGCVVKTMVDRFGSRPEDIRVSIGPGLRLGCFRVLEEEGRLFAEIHPSCQADTVEPVCHRVDKANPQNEDTPGLKSHGKPLYHEDLQVHETSRPSNEELNARNRSDHADEKEPETPLLIPRTSEEGGSIPPSHVDTVGNRCSPLEELTVEQVPADELKPKSPRPRKNSRLQWTFVDLQMTNYHVLLQAGVKPEHVDLSTSHCTRCNPDLFFSYERDGFPFGNQIGFICMPSGASV